MMTWKIIWCFSQSIDFHKKIGNNDHFSVWISKRLSHETINPLADSLAATLNYISTKTQVNFDASCFNQDNITFPHKQVLNICIVCKINAWSYIFGTDFVLENSLFEAIRLTKNSALDKYKYFGYGIGFDSRVSFSLTNSGGFGKKNYNICC